MDFFVLTFFLYGHNNKRIVFNIDNSDPKKGENIFICLLCNSKWKIFTSICAQKSVVFQFLPLKSKLFRPYVRKAFLTVAYGQRSLIFLYPTLTLKTRRIHLKFQTIKSLKTHGNFVFIKIRLNSFLNKSVN